MKWRVAVRKGELCKEVGRKECEKVLKKRNGKTGEGEMEKRLGWNKDAREKKYKEAEKKGGRKNGRIKLKYNGRLGRRKEG